MLLPLCDFLSEKTYSSYKSLRCRAHGSPRKEEGAFSSRLGMEGSKGSQRGRDARSAMR